MAHSRVAVDKTAEDYWVSLFGEYGRQFVREIPRVIKAAVLPEFRRAAAAGSRVDMRNASVVYLGHGVTAANGLIVDGIVKTASTETGSRLFCAEFSEEGDLLDISTRTVAV